ncbi:YidC/Oxa1 family membrane protein insertase [Sneathiella marina]|uniref:YidC/Oxa1 family membrane protein insertase n=1 Tax=Sneathiella marina TaxID=2950108 RepID=A0ABY4W476_9PROT|nr:YidC/Oxa1 family membrane protein insertase [Sneathiella marina]USG61995.1 YidC/Oxa1 family membrane protein insertase [Sneathiella marina]
MNIVISYYESLFLFISNIVHSYGLATILLSLFVSLLLIKPTKLANLIVYKETSFQTVLAPQVERIKKESKGAEQHTRLNNLYNRYSYHPIYSVRKLLGLFIQLPLLVLTYFMFEQLDVLNGEQFIFIKNLGGPDNLILGQGNLLPFIMTFVNVAAALTTPNFTKNDLIQAFGVSLLFLVLLYNAKSVLLIYWTVSNAFILFRNIIIMRNADKRGVLLISTVSRRQIYDFLINKYTVSLCIFVISFCLIDHFLPTQIADENSNIVALIISLEIILFYFSVKFSYNFSYLSKFVLYVLFLLQVAMAFGQISDQYRLPSLLFINISFLVLGVQAALFFGVLGNTASLSYSQAKLRLVSLGFLSLLIFIIVLDNPLNLYLSDPSEYYGIEYFTILLANITIFCLAIMLGYILLRFSSENIVKSILILSVYLSTIFFVYSKLVGLNYGLLDNFTFNQPDLINVSAFHSILEFTVLVGLFLLFLKNFNKLQSYFVPLLLLLFITSLATISVSAASLLVANAGNTDNQTESSYLEARDFNLTLSKSGKNVLVIILDGFSGGLFPELVKENRKIRNGFKDFTWYKNSVANSGGTIGSLPSIFGGHRFHIENVIPSSNDRMLDTLADSYLVLPELFKPKGYNSNIVQPKFNVKISNKDASIYKIDGNGYANSNNPEADNFVIRSLIKFSILKSFPLFFREHFYFTYLDKTHNDESTNSKLKMIKLLDSLSEKEVATSEKPTLNFIHLHVPHGPNVIDQEGNISQKGKGDYKAEATYSLLQLAKIFERMKADKVYNSTQIQVVSDHGWWVDNPMFDPAFVDQIGIGYEGRRMPGFFHALFLVKNVDAHQPELHTSNALTTSGDVATMACEVIGGCPRILSLDEIFSEDREVKYSILDLKGVSKNGSFKDYLVEQWSVEKSIFEHTNWKRN